jgi:hypothetical protein
VKKQLVENMLKGKLEPACFWSAELVCAGHYTELWEIILQYVGKHIHLGNPKIVLYLQLRYNMFKQIIAKGHFLNELQLRNDIQIRKLFAEMICVITLSNKKNSLEPLKINREEEFDMTQMTERLKAPSAHYAEAILLKDDPKELFIPVNEFAYQISNERKNMLSACYWIEWIIEFDAICKKRKTPCYCQRRPFMKVESKYSLDIIWILWDVLLQQSALMKNEFVEKLMTGLVEIFSIKYTTASCKKRRYLLYFAVALLTETVPTNIELIGDKPIMQTVLSQINKIYIQIKKKENSPNTEYLFSGMDKQNNLEKSVKKMELMNSIDIFNPK